ncbi:MAG: DnaJ domain-containing protein [Myxococcales bacterium]|nr:DnaJ domain-containing protein [Myxococcales bacterium]
MTSPSRPHPTAEGRFGKTPFAHVLLYIRERALSGTLSVDGPAGGPLAGEHFFVFEQGALAQSWLATGLDKLGDVLVESKHMPAAARKDADVLLQSTQQLAGEVFVEMGLCDERAIIEALVEQNHRRALHIFSLGNATYRFYQDIDLLQSFGRERYSIDVLSIVWRGVSASPPHASIDQVLTRVGDSPISLKPNAQLDAFSFGDDVQPLLDVLRLGPATVRDLQSFSKDPEHARVLAYVLLTSKQAEADLTGRGSVTPPPPARSSTPSPTPTQSTGGASPSLPPPLPTAHAAQPTPAARPAPPPPAVGMVDPKALEADVLFRQMDEQTYYEMLGLAKTASSDDIRASFVKLAAKWHPDRAPTPVAKEAFQRVFSMINEAHQTLSDDTMRTRYNRIASDGGGTPAAQRKVNAMLEAATLAQKADIHLKRRDFVEAEKLAREAVALHREDPSVLTVLGAVLLERGAPELVDEAIATITEAVTLSEKNDRAQTLLAQAYKRKGDAAKALVHFKLALEANPKNIDAAREVRLADIRARGGGDAAKKDEPAKGGSEKPTTAGGLFSKLFKR